MKLWSAWICPVVLEDAPSGCTSSRTGLCLSKIGVRGSSRCGWIYDPELDFLSEKSGVISWWGTYQKIEENWSFSLEPWCANLPNEPKVLQMSLCMHGYSQKLLLFRWVTIRVHCQEKRPTTAMWKTMKLTGNQLERDTHLFHILLD